LLLKTSLFFLGKSVLIIKKVIYAAPTIFIGNWIFGTRLYRKDENSIHRIISMQHPENTPKLNLKLFLKPSFLAIFIVTILFGPGV